MINKEGYIMKVFVVGANGQIAKQLVYLLHNSDEYTVRAMVRKEEQLEAFQKDGIEAVLADLEGSVDHIAEAMKGCDAVVFSAGSGGHTGADKTLLVDLDGAVKTIEAAEQIGIERYLMVSAFQANNRENWNERIRHYYVAKHYADRILMDSKLNYTIVRPGGLLNEPGTGKVTIGENLEERETIPREDVAKVLYEVLSAKNTYRKAFDLVSGSTDIKEAVRSI